MENGPIGIKSSTNEPIGNNESVENWILQIFFNKRRFHKKDFTSTACKITTGVPDP
jgi:hypothetical protein